MSRLGFASLNEFCLKFLVVSRLFHAFVDVRIVRNLLVPVPFLEYGGVEPSPAVSSHCCLLV